jgi:hypothetical protein
MAYEAEAADLEKQAEVHKKLAQAYLKPGAKSWQKAQLPHCNSTVTNLQAAALQLRAMAAEHHRLAAQSSGH